MNYNFITHRSQEQTRLHKFRMDSEMKYDRYLILQ